MTKEVKINEIREKIMKTLEAFRLATINFNVDEDVGLVSIDYINKIISLLPIRFLRKKCPECVNRDDAPLSIDEPCPVCNDAGYEYKDIPKDIKLSGVIELIKEDWEIVGC